VWALDATNRRGVVVWWRPGYTELAEKSLEAEAAALALRRPRDTQLRHISSIGADHPSALAHAWRSCLVRVGMVVPVGKERVAGAEDGTENWRREAAPVRWGRQGDGPVRW
jgi:hypothetical protein